MVKQVSLFCTGIVQKMSIAKVNICSVYVKDGNSAKKVEILLPSLLNRLFRIKERSFLYGLDWFCPFHRFILS